MTMTDDGVLTLRLRSLPPGPIGEGTMRYKPGDPEYEDIKKHIGGIAPGAIPPCAETEPSPFTSTLSTPLALPVAVVV